MTRLLSLLTNLFPVWVLICCGVALVEPAAFTWVNRTMIIWGLGIIMLGMGITLSLDDFAKVVTMPKSIATGLAAQFFLMPLCAWTIARILDLPIPSLEASSPRSGVLIHPQQQENNGIRPAIPKLPMLNG